MQSRTSSSGKRRLFIVSSFILILIASAVGLRWYQAPSFDATSQPALSGLSEGRSVLLITVDTTRPDRLEPYGADNVATPVLQRLAQQGVVFENALAVAPITLVAHTSMLTGTYPFEHGVRNNGLQYVPDSATTLAEQFKAAGYHTAAFISAAVLDRRYGLAQGFDVYNDDLSERRNRAARMVADRPAENTINAATAWLDTLAADERFFLWVHLYDPHASYSPPPPFRDDYRDRLYDGEIAYMDQQIGRLLQHTRIMDAGDQAPIVTVIGDHGESLGEHGERTHAILAYDATLHIPWIFHIPGGPAGLRIEEPVGQVDLVPTVLSLVGLSWDTDKDRLSGRDLVPVMEGRSSDPQHPYYAETFLPYYTYGWAKLRVLRNGRWKWIDAPVPELYDLVRDPKELTDLREQETGIAHDLKRDLDEWLARFDADRETSLPLDSEELAKLRGLGYLSVGSGQADDREDRPNPMVMIEQHVSLERARSFLSDRLYSHAVQQLEAVLEHDPQNLAALLDLVRAYEGLGEIDTAIDMAERALALDPEYMQTYLVLARLEAQRDNLEQALELSDLAVQRDPKNPDARILKVSFLNRLGRFDEVRQVLTETLAENPEHPRTNAVYAHLVEARSGALDAAEQRLRDALARDPFLEQGWRFLGALLERRQRWTEAEASYQQGLKGRPDTAELHGALGHLFARMGRHAEAETQLREAIRLSSKPLTELHVSLGAVLAEMERFEDAQREYDKVLQLDSGHPGARNNAAIALYRMGRTAAAKTALEEIIAKYPRHADAHNNLAAIAVDQEDWQAAIKHSRQTLELVPQLVEAWNNLAIASEELGQLEEAKKAYQKALTLDPEYWPAYFNLGYLLKNSGQATAAAEAFNQVLIRFPNHGETHLELGELYAELLADPGQARIHWNAFLRHSPSHPRRTEIYRRLAAL